VEWDAEPLEINGESDHVHMLLGWIPSVRRAWWRTMSRKSDLFEAAGRRFATTQAGWRCLWAATPPQTG
jgi:hypothetical protein